MVDDILINLFSHSVTDYKIKLCKFSASKKERLERLLQVIDVDLH